MNKTAVFLLSLLVSLTVLTAACMWVFPKTSPSPTETVGQTRHDRSFSLRLSWHNGEQTAAVTLCFDPAAERIQVRGDQTAADRTAVMSANGFEQLLAALGNDLPLTLPQAVEIENEACYLRLEAGAHLLTAAQVTALLTDRPERFPAVVAATLNAYATADRDPTEMLILLINGCESTTLSAKDGAVAADRLRRLWNANRGGLAVLQ